MQSLPQVASDDFTVRLKLRKKPMEPERGHYGAVILADAGGG